MYLIIILLGVSLMVDVRLAGALIVCIGIFMALTL
jgi:hypothetical protein